MMNPTRRSLYRSFAALLEYPTAELEARARHCAGQMLFLAPSSVEHILTFADRVAQTSVGRMEEIYTATFDVNPTCFIFAGYILFGESFKRGKFLVRLQEEYRKRGFSAGQELADHLAVLFRFLSVTDPEDEFGQDLIADCLTPVVEKMLAGFSTEKASRNPYRRVLLAILEVLKTAPQPVPAA